MAVGIPCRRYDRIKFASKRRKRRVLKAIAIAPLKFVAAQPHRRHALSDQRLSHKYLHSTCLQRNHSVGTHQKIIDPNDRTANIERAAMFGERVEDHPAFAPGAVLLPTVRPGTLM